MASGSGRRRPRRRLCVAGALEESFGQDLVAPSHAPRAFASRRRPALAAVREAERARTEAEVVVAPPVAEVVARLFAGLRVVRDLVVREARGPSASSMAKKASATVAVVGERQPAPPRELAELRARLDGQLVARRGGEARGRASSGASSAARVRGRLARAARR